MFTRTFIIRTLVAILLLAPTLGFLLTFFNPHSESKVNLHPDKRTDTQLLTTINTQKNEISTVVEFSDLKIKSSKRYNDIWYLVTLQGRYRNGDTNAEQTGTTKAVVGDFKNSANDLTLVVPPGGKSRYTDISESMGMPYALLEDLNTSEDEL